MYRVDRWTWSVPAKVHRGWLPAGATMPADLPGAHLELQLNIQPEGAGWLLVWKLSDPRQAIPGNNMRGGCSWHETAEAAFAYARSSFGVPRSAWRTIGDDTV